MSEMDMSWNWIAQKEETYYEFVTILGQKVVFFAVHIQYSISLITCVHKMIESSPKFKVVLYASGHLLCLLW